MHTHELSPQLSYHHFSCKDNIYIYIDITNKACLYVCMSCNDIPQITRIVTKTHLQALSPTQPTNGFLLVRCSRCRMAHAMWHNGRMTRDTARCEGILVICLFCFRILIRSMGLVYLPRWNPWVSWWMSIGKYTIPMHANGILFDEQSPIAALNEVFLLFCHSKIWGK